MVRQLGSRTSFEQIDIRHTRLLGNLQVLPAADTGVLFAEEHVGVSGVIFPRIHLRAQSLIVSINVQNIIKMEKF